MVQISKKKLILVIAVIIVEILLCLLISQIDNFKYYFGDSFIYPDGYEEKDERVAGTNYCVAHVKFVESKKHLQSAKRTEYVFEVLDWIYCNDENLFENKEMLSVYSEAFPKKEKSYAELYDLNYGFEYHTEEEYIIVFVPQNDIGVEYMQFKPRYYLSLTNSFSKNFRSSKNFFDSFYNRHYHDSPLSYNMTKEETVSWLKNYYSQKP